MDLWDLESVKNALDILAEKSSSIDALGPTSVALYRRVPLGSLRRSPTRESINCWPGQLLALAGGEAP